MKIAVIGAGISGLGSAYLLSKKHDVDLYEKEVRLGGHARTTFVHEGEEEFGIDTGFLVFNYETYPLLTKLFKQLGVKVENSNMSFGFWDKKTDVAYNADSLSGMFFQKKNIFSYNHYKMIMDILKFNKKANNDLKIEHKDLNKTLGEYLKDFSEVFKQRYILPMGAAIWSTPDTKINDFPARTFLQFFKNHGLLGVNTHHQWLTVSNGSINYVKKIAQYISGKIVVNSDIVKIKREKQKVVLQNSHNECFIYDKVIFACHAPDVLKLLEDATQEEKEILSCFSYKQNNAILHTDTNALYPNKKAYASWNYTNNEDRTSVSLSYWINKLQNLKTQKNYFVTLNETYEFKKYIEKITYEHPQFDKEAINAQEKRELINGKNNTYFAGAYWRYGFHEDGLFSANTIAKEFGCEL